MSQQKARGTCEICSTPAEQWTGKPLQSTLYLENPGRDGIYLMALNYYFSFAVEYDSAERFELQVKEAQ